MSAYILGFQETGKTKLALTGGKGANLGELSRIEGIQVPGGFCVTTEAYKEIIGNNRTFNSLLDQLSVLKADNRKDIGETSAKIRKLIEAITIPEGISKEITRQLEQLGEGNAYAVRSSATAEDLPNASFAGQQDTYLNITGKKAILEYISKCWASLFTDRAVTYRLQNGFDHTKVHLSVVIQKMVFPQVAGILFTADPVTGNRKVLSIDASFGLGEALVSGLVNADIYKVRSAEVIDKKIATKKLAIYAFKDGGTEQQEIPSEMQSKQALTDEQILQLARIGRKIEEHFGAPQDIEWCLADGTFYIVQSRPITTFFPLPEANDQQNRVYVSVGHQQMVTDPIKPLGISVWMLTGNRAMFKTAAGRLFVDITMGLSSVAGRQNLLGVLGHSGPLIKDALTTIIERDFIKLDPNDKNQPGPIKSHIGMSSADILAEAGDDPAIVAHLIQSSKTSLADLKNKIQTKSEEDVFDCILEDTQHRRQLASDQKNLSVIMAGIHASAWINEKKNEWLGEKNVADTLSLSVPNNVTSEMGMALLDVADVIRPYPEIIKYLQQVKDDNFLNELLQFKGGQQVRDVIAAYLDKYGMRCAGVFHITSTRWCG
ncbi:phosphoenolpyruvate synthase, partial [Chitinophaga sp. GbtcB8]|uniref:phosphoenolpyruvate synthase n=1 Tax=Chitinophaga sp. GbtcB8 TaxID=2824753 RepID=UPI001C2FBD36